MKTAIRFFCFIAFPIFVSGRAFAQKCPMTGDAKSVSVKALNILKNRKVAPRPDQFDTAITLQRMLEPGNDTNRFDEHAGAVIEGIVVGVKVGGIETVNCHAKDPAHRDTHIELALTENAPTNKRVIVEVTPRWREKMAAQGADWSTSNLQAALLGKRVRISGWMMFDAEHVGESENTAPGNPRDWRATVWEIHPITSIEPLN